MIMSRLKIVELNSLRAEDYGYGQGNMEKSIDLGRA